MRRNNNSFDMIVRACFTN